MYMYTLIKANKKFCAGQDQTNRQRSRVRSAYSAAMAKLAQLVRALLSYQIKHRLFPARWNGACGRSRKMALESVLSSDDDALPAVCTSSARRRRCRPQHRPGPGRKPRAGGHFHLLQGSKRSPAARSRLPSPSANRPRHGEPPSPIQEPERPSEAGIASHCVTYLHHMTS